jgi:hypothetical protein
VSLHHTCELIKPVLPLTVPSRYGNGLNAPALVDIYHTPNTTMLFLHQYGSSNTSYSWYHADGCNSDTKPLYMCVAGIEKDPKAYTAKFNAIKSILEAVSNTPELPCRLEVIDAMPYSQNQNASMPCTGILRGYNDPSRVGGDVGPGTAVNWAWEMTGVQLKAVMLASETEPDGQLVQAFEKAISVALCQDFDSAQGECIDRDE